MNLFQRIETGLDAYIIVHLVVSEVYAIIFVLC